jgi:hypothetical protein
MVVRIGTYRRQTLAVRMRVSLACVALGILLLDAAPSRCQQQAATQSAPSVGGATDLQKATQNPVASLISVPIQNNSNFGIGPFDRTQNVLNIQPVIPINASENWNLVVRWIAPIIWQPAPGTANLEVFGIEENTPPYLAAQSVQQSAGVFGFGDMTPTFFLSPAKPGKLIWGAGPVFVLPTATSKVLGQGKFSMGPSLVMLVQPGKWTLGALVNNAWSVAGPSDRSDVNQMTLQYFVNYNLKKGWYLSTSPVISANWKASNGNVWTVPVGGGVGRVFRLGLQPVNMAAQFYVNAAHPQNGSNWSMRLQIAFLFPKLPPAVKEKLKALQQ